ncbi:MAG: fused MFS/spermidine synthase [Candidatus Xenobia bacterium]
MRRVTGWLLACFLVSGASALAYEVLWTRMLGWVFGTTIYAISTTVTAFMAGLALGSWIGGRVIDRQRNVLAIYCGIEAAMGLLGIGITLLLPHLTFNLPAVLLPVTRFIVVFAILLIPTTLMGATLPTLTRYIASHQPGLGHIVANLYAINTCGAVLGAIGCDFVLIPMLGMRGTGTLAACGNLGIAVTIALFARALKAPVAAPAPEDPAPLPGWVTLSFAVSGFCALACEVLWTRSLVYFLGAEIFVFSIILSVFLTGIALGAVLVRHAIDTHPHPARLLSKLQLLLGTFGLANLFVLSRLDGIIDQIQAGATVWQHYLATGAAACVLLMLPATLVMGALFPLYIRLGAGQSRSGFAVGKLYAVNTIGSALGSLTAGFLLLPGLGLQRAIFAVALLNLLLAVHALLQDLPRAALRPLAVGGWAIAALATFALPANWLLAHTYETRYGPLEFFREDLEGTLAIATLQDFDGSFFLRLIVNGFSMTGTTFKSQRYMKLLGHLPTVLCPQPRTALLICLGTGQTLSALVAHPELTRIDVVDLSPGVRAALPYFAAYNDHAYLDPRVHIHIDDGRHWLLTHDTHYDVITFEPPPPRNAGIVNLYSEDYYRLCCARLNPHGMVCQWLPIHQMTPRDMAACIHAFTNALPYTSLWSGFAYTDLALLGSPDPIVLSPSQMHFAPVAEKLKAIGVDDPESLLATYLKGDDSLRRYGAAVPPVTDDRPSLEYSFPQTVEVDANWLFAHRDEAPITGPVDRAALHRGHVLNDSIYQYYIYSLYAGDPAFQQDRLGDALHQWAPDNPYARYVLRNTDAWLTLLNQQPDNFNKFMARARFYRFRGRWAEAGADYVAAARLLPSAQASYGAGLMEMLQGRPRKARPWLQQALSQCHDPEMRADLDRFLNR